MALIRFEPAHELNSLQHDVNRLFNSFFDVPRATAQVPQRWLPAADLVETQDAYVLKLDLPGLGDEDVKIEVEDNVLTITGERHSEHEEQTKDGLHRLERASGKFSRTLSLPDGVDAAAIVANFERGVLAVSIPKPPEQKPQRVVIGVGATPATIDG